MTQKIYLNALNQTTVLGPKKIFHLLNFFDKNAQRVWLAPLSELKKTKLREDSLIKFVSERKNIKPEKEWEKLMNLGIEVILHPQTITTTPQKRSNAYPTLLSQIPVPPPVLYLKGKIESNFPDHRIAVVGSRKISLYGRRVTENIAYELALNKIVIVSGLALGVDTVAHQACLAAGTPTIAVLANGLDQIYPATNTNLAQKIIAEQGAILSEFPVGTPPLRQHFPQRNRIISGLCQGVLVTEANLKSGSLITVAHALEQNRDIFAIPGNIYNENSSGTNNLIKQGAKLITTTEDILSELNLQNFQIYVKTKNILPNSPSQKIIYNNLSRQPIFIDDLIKKVQLPAQEVNAALTLMEIKGIIKNIGANQYVIK